MAEVASKEGRSVTMFAGEEELISTERLAGILGVHLNTARALCRNGEVPAVRIGNRWYVPRARLVAFVEGEHA